MPPSTSTRRRYFATAIAGLALVGATAGLTWWLTRQAPSNPAPILTRLTSDSGLTTDPALSPDGKLLAYASDRSGDGNLDIWLQQVGKGEAIRLTTDPADDREPAFSPDGTRIAFRAERDGGGIDVVSALGGAVTRIASQGQRPRFSPDGSWIAYWSGSIGGDFSRVAASRTYVVAASGGAPAQVQPEFAVTRYPIWSPDGKHILFLGSREPNSLLGADSWDWWVAPLDTGPAVRTGALAVLRQRGLGALHHGGVPIPGVWSGEGHVIFAADLGDARNIWQLRISPTNWRVTETPQRLTSGAEMEDLPSAAIDRIVFSMLAENIDIWSLPLTAIQGKVAGNIQRLTDNASLDIKPAISADGQQLVFQSNRSGNYDIWVKDLRTGKETPVTISPMNEHAPAISADGSKIAYAPHWGQKGELRIVSLRGRTESAAEIMCDCYHPWDWSPDSRHLLHWSSDQKQIGVLDIASREKAIVLKHPDYALLRSHFSPNGRWIAFHALGPDRRPLYIAPFQGMSPISQDKWIPMTNSNTLEVPRWSPDSNSLYLVSDRDGYRCLWRQRLDPETKRPLGEAKPVYHLHGARRSISSVPVHFLEMSVARDKVVFPMGERTGNIWMAEWKP